MALHDQIMKYIELLHAEQQQNTHLARRASSAFVDWFRLLYTHDMVDMSVCP